MLSPESLKRGYLNSLEVEAYKGLEGLPIGKRGEALNESIQALTQGRYQVVGRYHSFRSPIAITHLECNKTFKLSPRSFLIGHRCPVCEPNRKGLAFNHEQFARHVSDLTQQEYEVIGKYKGMNEYVTFKHQTCGFEFETLASNFIKKNSRCPNCRYVHQRQTRKRNAGNLFKTRVRESWNGEYQLVSEYHNQDTELTLLHEPCQTTFEMKPRSFLNGIKIPCPTCRQVESRKRQQKQSSYKKRTPESFREEVASLVHDEYEVLTDYEARSKKVWMRHTLCNHHYPVRPADFLKGSRCPLCAYHAPKHLTLRTSIEVNEA